MKLNKKTIAVSTASLVLVGGASAFAYLSAEGEGTGTATVASSGPEFDNVLAVPAGNITALDVPVGVTVTLTAPSNGMHINSITVAPDSTNLAWPAACDADFVVGSTTAPAYNVTLATGNHTLLPAATGLQVTLQNDPAHSQDGCLGASLPLKVTIN